MPEQETPEEVPDAEKQEGDEVDKEEKKNS